MFPKECIVMGLSPCRHAGHFDAVLHDPKLFASSSVAKTCARAWFKMLTAPVSVSLPMSMALASALALRG
jgi:hypothetical protein